MTAPRRPPPGARRLPLRAAAVMLAWAAAMPVCAQDRPTGPATPGPAKPVTDGPAWHALTAAQREALAPLQRDWPSIDGNRKAKWLDVAARFPRMPADERQRIQERMAEWARLTPAERGRARLQFQQARQFPAEDRQARWEAYRALPDEARAELARRGSKGPQKPAAAASDNRPSTATATKRNVLPPGAPATAMYKPVTPTAVQVKPGATTTLLSQKPQAPVHQQAGLPKVAATEGFVDPKTLLPRRGAQAAAVRSAAAPSQPQPQADP